VVYISWILSVISYDVWLVVKVTPLHDKLNDIAVLVAPLKVVYNRPYTGTPLVKVPFASWNGAVLTILLIPVPFECKFSCNELDARVGNELSQILI